MPAADCEAAVAALNSLKWIPNNGNAVGVSIKMDVKGGGVTTIALLPAFICKKLSVI